MARVVLPPAGALAGDETGSWHAGRTHIRFVVDSGWRPVVSATIDGIEVPMLLHANAGFLAMLTHDALHRITGRRVRKEREFGLDHDLRLSTSGRGTAEVGVLTVAGRSMFGVRLEIFDLPTTNWEGMLGVHWLAASGAVVDFGSARLTVPRTAAERPATSSGHDSVDLCQDDATGRFTCLLSVGAGPAAPGRFVVSTVAETTLDVEYARRHGIEFGEPVGEEHGPTGAVIPVYRPTEPVQLRFGDRLLAAVRPSVYDIYAYGDNPRPVGRSGIAGYLGADVLLERRALIDFGSEAASLTE
jgi:hypothetical protein